MGISDHLCIKTENRKYNSVFAERQQYLHKFWGLVLVS